MAGEPDQGDGALADHGKHPHQKTIQESFGQIQMRLEEFAESLHGGSGDLGVEIQFVHNQRVTLQAAIC